MRARMALKYAGIQVEHREIALRNKPKSMLLASPKGTVPVLCIDELVLDQSLDIMRWALERSDPDGWSQVDEVESRVWIEKNDGPFKALLDQYKYLNRFPDLRREDVVSAAIELMLQPMEMRLNSSQYLLGNRMSWVDVAIFPFIRQFAAVNQTWFDGLALTSLKSWLDHHLRSELFHSVMDKYPTWSD
jgi:glutathione S-transferase